MRYLSLILLLACTTAFSAETGYRYVHPDGTVEFSDEPIPGGEEIKLREAPTIKFTPAVPSGSKPSGQGSSTKKSPKAASAADGITITSPSNDQTLWYTTSGLTVSVAVSPPPEEGQVINVTMDGQLVASGTGGSFHIAEVYRGTHTLRATLVAEGGSVISSSPPVTFHMKQHSVIDRKPAEPEQPSGSDPILP